MLQKKAVRILIADDDLDDHELIREALDECRLDAQIDSVYDGTQVMDYLLSRNAFKDLECCPSLVLLDLNMPRMGGLEVLGQITRFPELKSVPVYVITTSRNPVDRKRALEHGASGFYEKGASMPEMIRIILEICHRHFHGEN